LGFFIDVAIPVNIQDHKKSIAPGKSVIVFGKPDIPGLFSKVAAVKVVGYRIGVVKLPPQCTIYCNIIGGFWSSQ
jgi:hypothetical protein